MWFVDIVCDFGWFVAAKGSKGQPLLRQEVPCDDLPSPAVICIYGTSAELHHARVLLDAKDKATADLILERDLQYWLRVLEVSSLVVVGRVLTAYIIPGTTSYITILGEGGEESPLLLLEPTYAEGPPLDIHALQSCVANWKRSAESHLFYISRFLNDTLPLDVRWLHGYRLAEWHFQPGKEGLSRSSRWRELVSTRANELAPLLSHGQTAYGLLEQVRATAAHAIAQPPPREERLRTPDELVRLTFPVMHALVVEIANAPELSNGKVSLVVRD
jgi:hypothetical protein